MKTMLVAVAVLCLIPGPLQRTRPCAVATAVTPAADAEGTQIVRQLPSAIVPNLGQWAHSARYVTKIDGVTVFFDRKGWTFALREKADREGCEGRTAKWRPSVDDRASLLGVAVRMTFSGGRDTEIAAEEQLPGRHNYFLGDDPSKWRSDVPLYRCVRYRDVQPGVDVGVHEQGGHFEYDLLLQAGAVLEAVEVAVEGVERMHLDGDALVLETLLGPMRMPEPVSWEQGPSGEMKAVRCRYALHGNCRFGFEVNGRRPGWALVVDPGLVWSTFLGGSGDDWANAVALDAQGSATVVGLTYSANFPTTIGVLDRSENGGDDVFVTRLTPTGASLVYSTFMGGANADIAYAVALDTQGAATIAGYTEGVGFPTTPGAFNTSYNGFGDAFVARLSPTGASLVYSTFLGGANGDYATAVAIDAQNEVTVAGRTNSAGFPTTAGALQTTLGGGDDAFVSRLSSTGAVLVYSTLLGGAGNDGATSLALDAQGATTIAGSTGSTNFPTSLGAFQATLGGSANAFVARLSPTGATLDYSTFLGGTNYDSANAVTLDAQGGTTVVGSTSSPNFPTSPGAFQTSLGGAANAFVTKFSPTGTNLICSTFVGGASSDVAYAVAIDGQGAITIAGQTASSNFPVTHGALQTTYGGSGDAFVARLSPTGASLVYSTFVGGTGWDSAFSVALDTQGTATVVGHSASALFPTTPGVFDRSYNGGPVFGDVFLSRLDMLPTGVTAYGTSTPGCSGLLISGVTSWPQVGNGAFAVCCSGAPGSNLGLLAMGAGGATTPLLLARAAIWIDLQLPVLAVLVGSDSTGAAHAPLPIASSPSLVGAHAFSQFFWLDTCAPGGVSASNALAIVLQQ